jgi:hypothetical protein
VIHNVHTFRAAARDLIPPAPTQPPAGDTGFQQVLQQVQTPAPTTPAPTTPAQQSVVAPAATVSLAPSTTPSVAPAATISVAPVATVTAPPVQLIGTGSTVGSDGGITYTASKNGYLMSNPTGTDLSGNPVAFNPNYYATSDAAAQFARAFGGTVALDPSSAYMTGPAQLAVRMPNGTLVNAGEIAQILGNDAAYANDRIKSKALADLCGVPWSGENFAACARTGESIANAVAAAVANPAALTGNELAYYQSHQPGAATTTSSTTSPNSAGSVKS